MPTLELIDNLPNDDACWNATRKFYLHDFCAIWVQDDPAQPGQSVMTSRPISPPWSQTVLTTMGYHSIAKDSAHARVLIVICQWLTIESKTHTSASPRTCYATLKIYHSWLSSPRAHCLRTDQSVQDPWSLIADYLNWIFGCRRSTSAVVLPCRFLDVRVDDCNLGVLGVELSSFI